MMRATGPSSTDIPAVAVQVFAAVGAESLGLKAELDSGSQVDLIPDMWVPWLINLGCVVRPCDMEVSWVQSHAGFTITHSIHVYLHFPAYAGPVTGGWLDLCVYSSASPTLVLGIETLRRFGLFRRGDDLAKVQYSLGLLAASPSASAEPDIIALDGRIVDLDEQLGPSAQLEAESSSLLHANAVGT